MISVENELADQFLQFSVKNKACECHCHDPDTGDFKMYSVDVEL